MNSAGLELHIHARNATVWLDRPGVHNAFDEHLIEALHHALVQLSADVRVRVIVLAGRGRSFCAGGDLAWMARQAQASHAANLEDARRLARMLQTLAHCAKPTIARVHGLALGGGLGLVAACDLALGSTESEFGATEVRLGLTPSTIAPHLLAAIGERAARRYVLTGERFGAAEALRIGLLHEVVAAEALDARLQQWLSSLCAAGPTAQTQAKRLLSSLRGRSSRDADVIEETAQSIAAVRAGPEAREGIAAFFEKRKPSWTD